MNKEEIDELIILSTLACKGFDIEYQLVPAGHPISPRAPRARIHYKWNITETCRSWENSLVFFRCGDYMVLLYDLLLKECVNLPTKGKGNDCYLTKVSYGDIVYWSKSSD